MKNFDKQTDYWKPCRPGTIRGISDSNFTRDRRKFIVRAAMGSVVVGIGMFTGMFTMNHRSRRSDELLVSSENPTETQYTAVKQIRLTCSDIVDNMVDYVLITHIEPTQLSHDQKLLKAEFSQHLAVCQKCVQLVDEALNA